MAEGAVFEGAVAALPRADGAAGVAEASWLASNEVPQGEGASGRPGPRPAAAAGVDAVEAEILA